MVSLAGWPARLPFHVPYLSGGDNEHSPTFSPDGRSLAYDAYDVYADLYAGRIGGSGIYISAADGSSPRRIVRCRCWTRNIAWSPDGSWLAFPYRTGIWLVHPNGTGLRRVIGTTVHDTDPAWLPPD